MVSKDRGYEIWVEAYKKSLIILKWKHTKEFHRILLKEFKEKFKDG